MKTFVIIFIIVSVIVGGAMLIIALADLFAEIKRSKAQKRKASEPSVDESPERDR